MSGGHTPGPWAVGANEPDRVFAVCDEDGRSFGSPIFEEPFRGYGCLSHERPTPESIANARLIAAAPELLKACETMMSRWPTDQHDGSPFYDEAVAMRAAIAKATGKAA